MVLLDLPDAVFRGYEGDDALLGMPRADDEAPWASCAGDRPPRTPEGVLPAGRRQARGSPALREVGIALLPKAAAGSCRARTTPGCRVLRGLPVRVVERLPRLEDLPRRRFDGSRRTMSLSPGYADIADQLERKISGITLYESQLEHLFGGDEEDGRERPGLRNAIGALGGLPRGPSGTGAPSAPDA